jgi:hypothetical protein
MPLTLLDLLNIRGQVGVEGSSEAMGASCVVDIKTGLFQVA